MAEPVPRNWLASPTIVFALALACLAPIGIFLARRNRPPSVMDALNKQGELCDRFNERSAGQFEDLDPRPNLAAMLSKESNVFVLDDVPEERSAEVNALLSQLMGEVGFDRIVVVEIAPLIFTVDGREFQSDKEGMRPYELTKEGEVIGRRIDLSDVAGPPEGSRIRRAD